MIHEMSAHHPWATFGNDMLLGIKADLATTQHQRQFLPHRLKEDFEHATIVSDGKARPLVKEERVIVEQGQQTVEEDFPLTPIQCSLIILTLFMLALTWEIRHKRCLVWVDALFMLLLGLAGCVLFVMLFSQHPATTLNLQLLLFNPIHLLYIYPVLRHKQDTSYWLFALVTVCLFLIGSLVQSYAEGTRILALCLLSRYWIHRRND
jgi:cation transport ATPase